MRKLDRAAVPAPPCLATYRHGAQTWNDLASEDKEHIRGALAQLQGRRCAYCEGPLDELGHHIEHFRRKSLHPMLTFAWANLYWSCDRTDCCGHYKDAGAGPYLPGDLLDPCNDDPDLFFHFRSNGTISVREGLKPVSRHRALETLRVFNLDADQGHLRAMRRRAVETYQAVEPGILEMLCESSEAERRAWIAEEIDRTAGEPFSTVIRHLFEDLP